MGCRNAAKKTNGNCLKGLLSSTPYGLAVQKSHPSPDGFGYYGRGNSDKKTHMTCLRRLLDQHGPNLAIGSTVGAPTTFDDILMGGSAADISHCIQLSEA